MGRVGTGTMPVPNKFRLFFKAKQSLKPRAANNTQSQPEMAIGLAISALELVCTGQVYLLTIDIFPK